MANDVVMVQLATRIPKALHQKLKLVAVKSDLSVMEIVQSAIDEKLAKLAKEK